jgi:general L-amino acid transport system substrate-binding protein
LLCTFRSAFQALCASLALIACIVAPASAATLDDILARGHLECAAADPLPGFAEQTEAGLWSGFDVDICRAVAAAIFNDPGKVVFHPLAGQSRFAQLQNGEIDLIARNGAWDILRDTNYGANYAAISFYDGQAFLVPQSLGVVSAYEMDNVKVCMVDDGDDINNIREFFFGIQAAYVEVTYEDREDLALAYLDGRCNVVSAPASWLYGIKRSMVDPAVHRILPERISRLPFGPVVRAGDDEWFNIVRWTIYALINAEELGVTQRNLDSMAAARTPAIRRLLGVEGDFGTSLRLDPKWMEHVIKAVGNYGEIFDRHFGPQTGAALLRGPNALWTKGGLLFAPPVR